MTPDQGNGFRRTDIWREGKWLDLWSAVHFLSGISVGFSIAFFHFGAFPSIVIALLLLVMYEMWEAISKIDETPQNRVMDVVVGMVSFVPTFFFAESLSLLNYFLVFACVLAINVGLSVVGWRASQKAKALEERMKARYQMERARMHTRREEISKRLLLRRLRKLERERLHRH